MVEHEQYIIHDVNGSETAPAAGTDIAGPQEVKYESKLLHLEIDVGEEAWFDVIVSEQDASGPTTVKRVYFPTGGHNTISGDLEDPILDIQANKEIKVQNSSAGSAGVDYSVKIRVAERMA